MTFTSTQLSHLSKVKNLFHLTWKIMSVFMLVFVANTSYGQMSYELREQDGKVQVESVNPSSIDIYIHGQDIPLTSSGQMEYEFDSKGSLVWFKSNNKDNKYQRLYHISKNKNQRLRIRHIPLWLSIVPPLIAIFLALIFKEVITSLFVGIWMGSFIVGGMRIDSLYYILKSLFNVVQDFILSALNNSGHLSVILFSLLIGGMVSLISKNGGMAGVVKSLSRYAKTPKSAQFITWFLGVAIFFDDYANTLIVGNTMRSVTDKFRISREKLAYIVDSTAAPVAAIAFITTWIGAELGYITDGIAKLPLEGSPTAYSIFLDSLKYSFYPILTLIFILFIIFLRKDYGPMLRAERRAASTGRVSSAMTPEEDEEDMEDLNPVENAPLRWYNAVIPVASVILMTIYGLLDTGFASIMSDLNATGDLQIYSWGEAWRNMDSLSADSSNVITKLGNIIGASDSYTALIWASLTGVIIALIMTWSQRIIALKDSMHWLVVGFKTMMPALIILSLAWALAITTEQLHTADYLSSSLANSINPHLLPVVIFILAALISFSTGSSWSTMAILYPIAIPTAYVVCQSNGVDGEHTMELLLNVIATVLGASVLGDHCSPISDTTILSSLASDCNHIDHVRTQLPYALTVGAVSCGCTFASTYFGGGWSISIILLVIAILILYLTVKYFGKDVDQHKYLEQ